METIRQRCPQCQATLELPASAMGRTARCPACQHTFPVTPASTEPAPTVTGEESPERDPSAAPPFSSPQSTAAGQPPTARDAGGAEPRPTYPSDPYAPSNPYAMTPGMAAADMAPVRKQGDLVIQRASIDDIISKTTSIFTARWQPLVLGGLIAFAFAFAAGMVIGVASFFILGQGPEVALIVNSALQLAVGFMTYYFNLGLIRIGLAVSRGEEASPTQVFAPLETYARALVPILPLVLIGASPQLVMFAIGENADPAFGPGVWVGLVPLVATIGASLISGLILLVTWPFLYLAADHRASNFGALALGFRIATTNLVNSFLFGLIAIVLSVGAGCTCGFAAIVTQPVLMLLGAVGYLAMTGQEIRDPNQTPTPVPNYTYTPGGQG